MSSTNRGAEREEDDQYFTRYPTALGICRQLAADGVTGNRILEPSAGKGSFVATAAEVWRPDTLVWNDLTPELLLPEHRTRAENNAKVLTGLSADFLLLQSAHTGLFDIVIGNPPYSDAEAHVRQGLNFLTEDGALAFLLRLNFLGGIDRGDTLWRDCPPEFVYALDKRPNFVDGYRINKEGKRVKKGTDSCEYGIFVWRKQRPAYEPVLRFLRWSPLLKQYQNKVECLPARVKKPKASFTLNPTANEVAYLEMLASSSAPVLGTRNEAE